MASPTVPVSSLTSYDGHNLSKEGDVVVVTLNHRLNVLGFLDLSAYGDKYKQSGNASVTDLVAALKWVHDNAEAFGGDPRNVTIFGQSGGGYKVRALMGTPAAKGLFQKAIVQSGSRTDSVTDQKSSRKVAELTLKNLGLKKNEVDKLAKVNYYDLLAASDKALKDAAAAGAKDARYAPVEDGSYIPENPVGTRWVDQASDIPLMVGNTLNEFETVINHKSAEPACRQPKRLGRRQGQGQAQGTLRRQGRRGRHGIRGRLPGEEAGRRLLHRPSLPPRRDTRSRPEGKAERSACLFLHVRL